MTIDSTLVTWIVIIGVVLVVLVLLRARRQGRPLDHDKIIEQTRQVAEKAAKEAAKEAAGQAQQAAIEAYQQQQDQLREEQTLRRREAAGRAKETKARRIQALQPWRETFVQFVRQLAKPVFDEFGVRGEVLSQVPNLL